VMASLTAASYEWTVWPRMRYGLWKGKSYLKAKLDWHIQLCTTSELLVDQCGANEQSKWRVWRHKYNSVLNDSRYLQLPIIKNQSTFKGILYVLVTVAGKVGNWHRW
jgi:hypothetical protein